MERKNKKNGKKIHSTQKPESLLHRVLLASTNKGDFVFDPFLEQELLLSWQKN